MQIFEFVRLLVEAMRACAKEALGHRIALSAAFEENAPRYPCILLLTRSLTAGEGFLATYILRVEVAAITTAALTSLRFVQAIDANFSQEKLNSALNVAPAAEGPLQLSYVASKGTELIQAPDTFSHKAFTLYELGIITVPQLMSPLAGASAI